MTADEVRVLLRAACDAVGGQNAWARAHGVSNAYVSDVLLGRREPGPAICGALAVTIITRYERTYCPAAGATAGGAEHE